MLDAMRLPAIMFEKNRRGLSSNDQYGGGLSLPERLQLRCSSEISWRGIVFGRDLLI